MCTRFRESEFIDFNKGHVRENPMHFANQISTPWTLANKIDVFECSVEVWQLGVAVEILKEIERHEDPSIWSHSAFGLVAVIFSYFEMIGKTLNQESKPSGTASQDFNHGFCDVYPEWKPADGDYSNANLPEVGGFRDRIRNGMYHLAGTKSNLFISRSILKKDFEVCKTSNDHEPSYSMDIHRVTRTIVDHFPDFVARLRKSESESSEMSKKFEEFFDTFRKAR